MSRSAALAWNGIAIGLGVCGLLVPGLHYVLNQIYPVVEVAQEATLLSVLFSGCAIILSIILRIGGAHLDQPVVRHLNTAALLLSLVVTSAWVAVIVILKTDQPSQTTKEDSPEPAIEEIAHPVHRGSEPHLLLVWDYVVELDVQLMSDLGLSVAEVESVLKRVYDPHRKKPGTDDVILWAPQDPRYLPTQIIRITEGRPLYLKDIAIIRDPAGRPMN